MTAEQTQGECGAMYGTGTATARCRRPAGHPPVSDDGIGHAQLQDAPLLRSPRRRTPRLYLTDTEMGALMREAHGPGHRVLQCGFGSGAVWVDPSVRDDQGRYPRWIVLRLAVLRGLDLSWMDVTDDEMAELTAFAAARKLVIVCA